MRSATAAIVVAVVVAAAAVVAEAGYVAPYTALANAEHHSAAYYDDHYAAGGYGAALGYAAGGYGAALGYAAPYAAYYGNPSGTYAYWGDHGPTVVQENAASLATFPITGHSHLYAPYSSLYAAYGAPAKTTVVQANLAGELASHWGLPAAYGAYGHEYGYGYDKYLPGGAALAAPLTKYLL